MTDKLKLKGLPEPNRSTVERSGAEIDRFKKEHTCAMCGCLINEDKGWLARRDFTCELCRLEYQDAFE